MKQLNLTSRDDWNGVRVYRFEEDPRFFLSVTSILDYCSAKERERWRTGKTEEQIKVTQDKGRIPGAKIHDLLQAYFQGVVPDITEDVQGVWDQFMFFKENHKLSTYLHEYPVAHEELGYAGTLDWFGSFSSCRNTLCCPDLYPKLTDHPCVLDWKTGRSAAGTSSVQLAAYRAAFQVMNPLYKDVRTVAVHLPRTGAPARALTTQRIDKTTQAWACALDWFKFSNFYKLNKDAWPWLDTLATEVLRKEWS